MSACPHCAAAAQQRETIRVQEARIADLEAKQLQLEHRVIGLEHRANDMQRAGNVLATWSNTIDDLIQALFYAQARMQRPQPSAEWRVYFAAHCEHCATWWRARPMRLLDGIWWINCPVCGECETR